MNKKIFFVTGTDTDVGKTVITCGFLEAARIEGYKTLGLKPLSAGCAVTDDGLINDDAIDLMHAMTCELSYEQVNPIALKLPVSPHIGAANERTTVTIDRLTGYCRSALTAPVDFSLIEGAGGWRVPINDSQMLSALPKALDVPVILVVGMKLGCLNHALLTAETIIRDGVTLAGWVANRIDLDMLCYKENIETLRAVMPAPCLGEVPYLDKRDNRVVASYLNLSSLLSGR